MFSIMQFSEFIRKRRQILGLSQADVAWLAGISRTTLSNLERGRGEPEPRTVIDVLVALGYPPLSPEDIERSGLPSAPIIDDVFMQRVAELIATERLFNEPNALRFAEHFSMFLKILGRLGTFEGADYRVLIELASMIVPRLNISSAIDQKVLEVLEGYGWSSRDPYDEKIVRPRSKLSSNPGRHGSTHASDRYLDEIVRGIDSKLDSITDAIDPILFLQRDAVKGFERLPVVVQDALLRGGVVEYDTHVPPDAPELTVINLIVREESAASALLANRRRTIEAIRRYSSMLLIARYLTEDMAGDRDSKEIVAAVMEVLRRSPEGG